MKNILVITPFIQLFNKIVNENTIQNSLLIRFDTEITEIDNIIEEANYISLFNDKKTIVIDNYNQEFDEKLIAYLEHFNENVKLIINITTKLSEKRKTTTPRLKELLDIMDYSKMNGYTINNLTSELFKKNNINITSKQINMITNKCLLNYDYIYNECQKLFIDAKNNMITDKDIEDYVSEYLSDDIFKFKDYVINNKIVEAIRILDFLSSKKEEIYPLISLLAKEYRLIYIMKNTSQPNLDILARELNISSSYPLTLAKEKASKFTNQELKNNLVKLANIDLDFKCGKISDIDGIKQFLYELLGGRL